MVEYKGPHVFKSDGLDFERGFMDLKEEAVLVLGLCLDEASGHCGAGLQKVNAVLVALEDLRDRLMFVGPDDQMEELWDHAFRDGVPPGDSKMHALVLVLVEHEDVEPVVFVFEGPFELDAFVFEGHVKALVLHVANAVERDLGGAFAEQDRDHLDVLNIGHLAEVVHVVVRRHQVDV
jgi:hypothetical protein